MTFQTEFPDYPAADMPAIPEGFVDISWKNDTCPSFEHKEHGFRLFVDYPNPADREWPEAPRFVLFPVCDDQVGADLLATEDWAEMLALISEYTAETQCAACSGLGAFPETGLHCDVCLGGGTVPNTKR